MELDNQIENYIMDVHYLWLLLECDGISDLSRKLRKSRKHVGYIMLHLLLKLALLLRVASANDEGSKKLYG